LAYIEPRETWTEAELLQFDGTTDDVTGPLLFAASGTVFNVWKGRHLYGPGCEYHIFAGRDATRLLAKSKLEEKRHSKKGRFLSALPRERPSKVGIGFLTTSMTSVASWKAAIQNPG
jgi:hypothetical protein